MSGSASIVATFVRGPTGEPTSQPTATSTPTPEPEDCTLTVTSGPGGTTLGGGTIPCGSGHLAAGAFRNACHDFTGWSGDHSGSNALIAVEMDSDKSVHAGFAHDGSTRTLTVQPSPAEAASRNTSMHRCGAEVTPTHPTANACWVASGTLSEVTMTGDRTVTADYDPSGERFTLTVRASPSEGGSTTGSGTYDCGTVVTATATANDGWRLVSWSPAARVRMTRSGSVTAHFERTTPPPPPSTYSLTVTETGCCGSVSVSPSGPYYQGDNTSVTLTATPSPDLPSGPSFSFDGWSGDCSGRSSTCTLTMDDDKSVTATFSNSCDGNTGIGCRRQEEGGEGDGEPPPPAP